MISAPVTAAIVAILAFFGVSPTAWLVGAIFVAVKAFIVLGGLGLAARLFGFKLPGRTEADVLPPEVVPVPVPEEVAPPVVR